MPLERRKFHRSRGALFCASVLFVLGSGLPAVAAEPETSAPKLLSTSGGKNGASWSSLAELKKAADANNPKACAQYGEMVLRGDDTPQDVPQGLAYLQKAVDGGEPNAAFRLGKTYYDGELVPRDYARAFSFYVTAAKAGVVEAQYNLGVMYVGAHGVKRDYVEGLAWLIVATKNGAAGDGEKQVREQLEKSKLPKKIAAAEQRAAEILKDPKAADPSGGAQPVVGAPEKTQAPAKIDLGSAAAAKITIAPPAATLPETGGSLGTPTLPPSSTASPANPNGTDKNKAEPGKSQ